MSKQEKPVRIDWRILGEMWEQLKPLLPTAKTQPLGRCRSRVAAREIMAAIFFKLRTGMQCKALNSIASA